jgi:tetratricopeptide (TPR) repeat protein
MRRFGIGLSIGLSLLALLALSAPLGAQQSDQLTKLQRDRAAKPGSVAANRALGLWYYKNGRFAESRVPLEEARKLDPKDGTSALYAGLAAEQVKDFTAAKSAYNAYLEVGKSRGVRDDIRGRLIALTKEELKSQAKAAVANEAAIAQQPGSPRVVAVLPLRFSGPDVANLGPLERGLADLLITDLSKSKSLTIVERDRMQAITDEINLAKTNQTDAASSVRAGKLIQAGRIVQGAINQVGPNGLAITSSVINTSDASQAGQTAQQNGSLDQLFTLEKSLVFQIFDRLGVTLTPAERQLVDQRPTSSVQAFLAYSRGLMAEDEGRIDEAARYFDNARSIDPGFGAALQRAQSAAAANGATLQRTESAIRNSSEGAALTVGSGLGNTLNNVVGDVNPTTTNQVAGTNTTSSGAPPTQRDAASEKTGTDQPAPKTGQVTIILKKP